MTALTEDAPPPAAHQAPDTQAVMDRRPRSAPEAVRRARLHLEGAYTRNVPLEELSEVAQLSRFHLVRVFAREYGVTPRAYLTALRLHDAAQRLAAGQRPAAVAALTGFADQSHLTRTMRAWLDTTPGRLGGRPSPFTLRRILLLMRQRRRAATPAAD